MDPIQKAAFVIGQAAELNARIAGMVAENKQREHLGQSMAFTQEHFESVIREYDLGYNGLLTFFQR